MSATLSPPEQSPNGSAPSGDIDIGGGGILSGGFNRISPAMAFAVIAGITAAILVFQWFRIQDQRVPIAVANRDLPAGTVIDSPADFGTVLVNADDNVLATLVAPSALSSFEGFTLSADIERGTMVPRAFLRPPTGTSNSRVMTFPVSRNIAVDGAISNGDRVDIIAVCGQTSFLIFKDMTISRSLLNQGGETIGLDVDLRQAQLMAEAVQGSTIFIVKSTGVDADDAPFEIEQFRECLSAVGDSGLTAPVVGAGTTQQPAATQQGAPVPNQNVGGGQ